MRIMYSILNILFSNKANSQLYALTQVDIEEALVKQGYVKEGLRKGNANTFYLTPEGIEWMKDVEGDTENE